MFLKLKKTLFSVFLSIFIIPSLVYAYSDYIYAGGENIGIEINSSGVFVVGYYDVGSNNNKSFQIGDRIISANGVSINNIQDFLSIINSNNSLSKLSVNFIRGNREMSSDLYLFNEDGNVKTGLYVKDSIVGVGTLSFVDPNSKLFGALGHEIIEKSSGQIFNVRDGKIFNTSVTNILRSENGNPGEKNAKFYTDNVVGKIYENTKQGIFLDDIPNKKLYKVAHPDEINKGNAKILTVLDDNIIHEFSINIIKLSNNQKNKNILFEITDDELLSKTGGIIQGMSGSPIIQDDKIIGAVTHVVVENPKKGYGIFITNMLEEAEN